MSENLQPKLPTISGWLRNATAKLNGIGIESARLDAEIILAHTLKHPRTFLHAHSEDTLEARFVEIANARIDLRLDRIPVAYIIGHKEFYGRRFKVTTSTLIPRPETEVMIDFLKEIMPSNLPLLPQTVHLVDVGTGSGILGITAKLEFPELEVTLCDISTHALTIAEKNAQSLGAEVTLIKSDLLNDYPFKPDLILANLPYVDVEWDVSPETNHEPSEALYAAKNGLALIEKLIFQASSRQTSGGHLLLEADERQHDSIIQSARSHDLTPTSTRGLILCFQKD